MSTPTLKDIDEMSVRFDCMCRCWVDLFVLRRVKNLSFTSSAVSTEYMEWNRLEFFSRGGGMSLLAWRGIFDASTFKFFCSSSVVRDGHLT